ncbi:MAG: Rne/Rng family ribonuclease [Gammaproteobacteria bacterium]|nr:Rne/Rng family ribonuclease [Gammaproteobacteria bacterium]
MKRMLINATQEEELRMAMVDGQRLFDLNIEGPASERKKANIYKGKITRVEPSLEAAFVDYGAARHGFLPLKEVSSEYFLTNVDAGKKPNIREVLKEGQDIVVQIDKEERGNKGAALTTYVSLAGRFIVLKPNKDRSGGVSRRIVGEDRDLARKSLNDVDIPKGMSVILRTAGIDRSAEELAWDLETLLKVWQAILDHVLRRPAPFLLYRESNAVVRALRDYLTNEIGEILVDDHATYEEALEFVGQVMPHNAKKLKYYDDPVPLFTRFQIESQIESAFAHSVTLPSGGSIVIDHTEALVSIDINSARATKGGDIEATALNTNLEAAEEIARQLRIRDLGGLVVIDFIDMGPQRNQRDVENRLRESVRQDRARVQIGKITRFGLLEMSRQRLRPSIGESAYQSCPRCSGFGTIRSNESLALAILRIIGEEARKERTAKVIAQLPVEVATYLLNEKRDWVQSLETNNDTQVVLVANSHLETPHYDIRRVRDDQTELPENAGVSYSFAEANTEAEIPQSIEERKIAEQAAIGVIQPSTPAPKRQKTGGFWAWLTGLFASDSKAKKPKKQVRRRKGASQSSHKRSGSQRTRQRSDQRQQGSNRKRSKKHPAKSKSQDASKDRTRKRTKKSKPDDQKPQKQAQAQAKKEDVGDEQKRPTRNRRTRGGRRRRRSADLPANESTETQQAQNQEQKPQRTQRDKKPQVQESQQPSTQTVDSAPPRARTDAERAAATEKPAASTPVSKPVATETTAKPEPRPESRPEPKPETKPAASDAPAKGNGSPEPAARKAAPKPAEKPAEKPADKTVDRPAEKAAEQPVSKPENRLLPWETPPAAVQKPTKPAADSSDQG